MKKINVSVATIIESYGLSLEELTYRNLFDAVMSSYHEQNFGVPEVIMYEYINNLWSYIQEVLNL